MMRPFLIALVGATTLCAPLQAAEITGGSVGLSFSAFTGDRDVNRLGLEGSVEVAFKRNVSLQFDLGHDRFGASDVDSTGAALHGIYHLNAATSLGAFYSYEDVEGASVDTLGIEVGHEFGQVDVAGYIARADDSVDDGTLVGLSGRYALDNGLGVGASFDRLDAGSADLRIIALRLDRDVSPDTNLFLEVGTARGGVGGLSDSETFVGLGGEIAFGAARGATFDRRGLMRLIPGL